MDKILEILGNLGSTTGIAQLFAWNSSAELLDNLIACLGPVVMIAIACLLLYLGIKKQFEPLLLVGISFGMLLSNLPRPGLQHPVSWYGYVAAVVILPVIFN